VPSRPEPLPKPLPITADPEAGGTRVDVVLYGDIAMALVAPNLQALRTCRPVPRPIPSFVAGSWLAVATVHGQVVGCARVEPTPVPFPASRTEVLGGLAADRCDGWLAGGLELVELAVDPEARGYGIGSMLQAVLAELARDRRAWVVLGGVERAAVPFFLRRGWTPPGCLDESAPAVVLVAAAHPALNAGPSPVRPADVDACGRSHPGDGPGRGVRPRLGGADGSRARSSGT
jgi:GNAT superfamily N-acetyltransferase